MVLLELASSSSLLAIAATLHLALAALCNHRRAPRGRFSFWAAPSAAFSLTPWLLPAPAALAAGLGLHAIWLATLEWVARRHSQSVPISESPHASTNSQSTIASQPRRSTSSRMAAGFVQVPVLAAFDESRDIRTIRLARPDDFDFEAGQFLTLRLRVDERELVRCYSISSAPASRGYLEISVKRAGVVSNALHAMARPGGLLSIKSPNGAFKYPAGDDRPIVLLAGGVGITPLISMLRHGVAAEPSRPITLLYSAQTAADLAFREELSLIAKRHPQVRVFFAISREQTCSAEVYPGRIDDGLLRTTVPDVAHSISCICGPEAMIDALRSQLAGFGVPARQIRYEVFSAAVAAAAVPRSSVSRPGRDAVATREMTCTMSSRTVPIAAGQTVLEAAEAAGIDVPSLCRAGVCGTCRTRVMAGDVECSSTTLSEDERQDGYVLACVAMARSACSVEL